MQTSRDGQEIVAAINKNTRAIEALSKTIEKVGKNSKALGVSLEYANQAISNESIAAPANSSNTVTP